MKETVDSTSWEFLKITKEDLALLLNCSHWLI